MLTEQTEADTVYGPKPDTLSRCQEPECKDTKDIVCVVCDCLYYVLIVTEAVAHLAAAVDVTVDGLVFSLLPLAGSPVDHSTEYCSPTCVSTLQ